MSWSLRALTSAFQQTEIVPFLRAEMVERFGAADGLAVDGRTDDLRPLVRDGYGAVLTDSEGALRFSGFLFDWQKRGDGTATLTFMGDLVRVFGRVLYADPARDWSAQTTQVYDVSTGPLETRLLYYIGRNAGPAAPLAYRRVPGLVLPASQGRGALGTSQKRFQSLAAEIPKFGELGGFRVSVLRQPDGSLPLTITVPPDSSTSALAPRLADETWTHSETVSSATSALVAGGGVGVARVTREVTDAAAEARIGRFELFVDQRDTSVPAELLESGEDALSEAQTVRSIEANVTATSALPVGTRVALLIDGLPVVDRIRTVSTIISGEGGDATVTVTPAFGTSDAGLTVAQRQMKLVGRTLGKLTRMETT